MDDNVVIHDPSPASSYLWRWGWKRPLGPGQFRLSALLTMVVIVACVLGLWRHRHDEQAPYRALHAVGAEIYFPNHSEAVEINLSGSDIADKDLAILSSVPLSITLNLSGTGVTDDAIDHLINARGLSFVDLTQTDISDSGLHRLTTARPDLSVGDFSKLSRLSW